MVSSVLANALTAWLFIVWKPAEMADMTRILVDAKN